MTYITEYNHRTYKGAAVTWEDLLFGDLPDTQPRHITKSGTITRMVPDDAFDPNGKSIQTMRQVIHSFVEMHKPLYEVDRRSLYHTFYIPKRSGGLRRIDQPEPQLMSALSQAKTILESTCGALHHTAAYAYVKGRSCVNAVERHQSFQSKWFLKTDFSNFFGNTTRDFALRMMSMCYPFSEIVKTEQGKRDFAQMLELCFLDGGLPQGTPASPAITNLMMVPIDHELSRTLAPRAFVYTRYADDILISARERFNYREVVKFIRDTLRQFGAPFDLKDEKTRFSSSSGSNWNLGVMLNKDNEITVGHMKKKYFKAAMCNFITDHLRGVRWTPSDAQQLAGTLSYYRMVERDYFDSLIRQYNQKFSVDFEQLLKADIAGNAT